MYKNRLQNQPKADDSAVESLTRSPPFGSILRKVGRTNTTGDGAA